MHQSLRFVFVRRKKRTLCELSISVQLDSKQNFRLKKKTHTEGRQNQRRKYFILNREEYDWNVFGFVLHRAQTDTLALGFVFPSECNWTNKFWAKLSRIQTSANFWISISLSFSPFRFVLFISSLLEETLPISFLYKSEIYPEKMPARCISTKFSLSAYFAIFPWVKLPCIVFSFIILYDLCFFFFPSLWLCSQLE